MSELLDFTRDEWADKPFLLELRGGYCDGERHHWHELPRIWRQPEPVPLDITAMRLAPMPAGSDCPVTNYRPTGNVTDDGAHIYQFGGYE